MAVPTTVLLMRLDSTASRKTAAALRRLGFAVTEFVDGCHLYAHAIGLATSRGHDPRSVVILAEATLEVVRDLQTLRGGSRPTPLVLVGDDADLDVARRLRAAYLPRAHSTREALRDAIAEALAC